MNNQERNKRKDYRKQFKKKEDEARLRDQFRRILKRKKPVIFVKHIRTTKTINGNFNRWYSFYAIFNGEIVNLVCAHLMKESRSDGNFYWHTSAPENQIGFLGRHLNINIERLKTRRLF